MPVVFRPQATCSLLYPLLVGASHDSLAKDITPLQDKVGKKVFSELVTITDDPTIHYGRRSFPSDDEGVHTTRKVIVERGVFKNFIFDPDSAARTGRKSTGHGFKEEMFAAGIEVPPNPRFTSLIKTPGEGNFDYWISEMKEGIIVGDLLGFHSGNLTQGEFSMNVGVGFYVNKGNIRGRVIDAMVAGNIYEDFLNTSSLSSRLGYNYLAYTPEI
jgi:PmbA protein